MIKKLFVLLAAFSLMTANASVPRNDIKTAIDRFNFAITFDWDQRDQAFYDKAVEDFKKSLSDLAKNGMSNEEVMISIVSSIKNKKQAEELKKMIGIIRADQMTRAEAIDFIVKNNHMTQSTGASFEGRRRGMVGIFVIGILIAAAVYFIHRDNDDDDDDNNHHEHEDDDFDHDYDDDNNDCWPAWGKTYNGGYGCSSDY